MAFYKGNSNGNRGRPYGLMLILAFGAALLGVLVVQRLRERRIFNLLAKDKDRQLLSLQLLLQKEREYNKDMKTKTEEMKAKLYFLRTQKMELDRRLLELQSTIDSLKDEQKTMESALEESQNEIKMLRAKEIDLGKETPQLVALTESLKQKDAEIEDLKHRLEHPINVWSEGMDDPSKPSTKFTMSTEQKEKKDANESEEERRFHEPTNYRAVDNTTQDEDGSQDAVAKFKDVDTTRVKDGNQNRLSGGMMNMTREVESQKLESSQQEGLQHEVATTEKRFDDGQGKRNEYSQQGAAHHIEKEMIIANEAAAVVKASAQVWKERDEDSVVESMDSKEPNNTQRGPQGDFESSKEDQRQELRVTSQGGMKLETADNIAIADSRMGVKHNHIRRNKGKRWRMFAKNRLLENIRYSKNLGSANMHTRRLSIDDQGLRGTEQVVFNDGNIKDEGATGVNNPQEARKAADTLKVGSMDHQKPDDAVNLKMEVSDTNADHQLKRLHEMPNEYQNRKVWTKSIESEANNSRRNGKKTTVDEVRQTEDQEDSEIQGKMNNRDEVRQTEDKEKSNGQEQTHIKDNSEENSVEQMKYFNKQVANEKEPNPDAANDDFFSSKLEEDQEAYREETDESEF